MQSWRDINLKPLHDRMPIIVSKDNEATWIAPLALHLDDFAGNGIDDRTDACNQLSPTIDLDLGNGIASFLTGKGDSFDLTLGWTDYVTTP